MFFKPLMSCVCVCDIFLLNWCQKLQENNVLDNVRQKLDKFSEKPESRFLDVHPEKLDSFINNETSTII